MLTSLTQDTKKHQMWKIFYFLLFRTTPVADGNSQARVWIGAAAAGLYHSHSNKRSKPCLWPTPQLIATPAPQPTEWSQGSNLDPSSWILVGFLPQGATAGTPRSGKSCPPEQYTFQEALGYYSYFFYCCSSWIREWHWVVRRIQVIWSSLPQLVKTDPEHDIGQAERAVHPSSCCPGDSLVRSAARGSFKGGKQGGTPAGCQNMWAWQRGSRASTWRGWCKMLTELSSSWQKQETKDTSEEKETEFLHVIVRAIFRGFFPSNSKVGFLFFFLTDHLTLVLWSNWVHMHTHTHTHTHTPLAHLVC